MGNKILEAVKALGGDLRNSYGSMRGDEGVLCLCHDGDYLVETMKEYYHGNLCGVGVICTISEFNTYAEQWLKEAYMHNAALDCNWDLYYRDGSKLICTSNDIVVHFDVDVCTEKEFIDYCNANKPCEEVDRVFTHEMAEAGERVKVGMRFSTEVAEYCAVAVNDKSVCFADEDGFLVSIPIKMAKPIKSPRDKAIDEMFAECYPNKKPSELMSIALGKLYDSGYRKEIK